MFTRNAFSTFMSQPHAARGGVADAWRGARGSALGGARQAKRSHVAASNSCLPNALPRTLLGEQLCAPQPSHLYALDHQPQPPSGLRHAM